MESTKQSITGNKERLKVLILILNFKKAKRVLQGVSDLYNQKINFDIQVVVGDNSCDKEEADLLSSLRKYPNLELRIFDKNYGYIKAHNF